MLPCNVSIRIVKLMRIYFKMRDFFRFFLTLICSVTFIVSCGDSISISEDTEKKDVSNSIPIMSGSSPYLPKVNEIDIDLGDSKGSPKELEAVWEAWAILNKEHVDRNTFNSDEFEESAIKGLINSVNDQHTSYIDPVVLDIEQTDLSGEFEGIGAHVRIRADGAIQIISPIEGGPAESAGIKPGDIILSVDGESLEGFSLLEAVSKIRGPRGSEVELLVKHVGQLEPVTINVVRDVIALPSVLVRSEPGDKIAHIRITEFKEDTPERLQESLTQLLVNGEAEGLILDVRNNPGGYLQKVFQIADMFLNESIILIEQRKDNEVIWESSDGGLAVDVPLVLLVNRYSASGSEILMGAFQDTDRAKVVGERTFGKGTVNMFKKLSNGGGLYMSIGRWYTPDRRIIEGEGLEPDIEVTDRDPKEADIKQIEKAKEILDSLINS
ncbi:MAG: hypothetical protein CL781_01115 [Chloroflexi bacterium]|nr:hypothetical protein [Chloroflexota bacterium]